MRLVRFGNCALRPSMRAAALFLIAMPTGAWAADSGTAIPEPSNLALFALGVLGVIVGRQAAKRRAGDDEAD